MSAREPGPLDVQMKPLFDAAKQRLAAFKAKMEAANAVQRAEFEAKQTAESDDAK